MGTARQAVIQHGAFKAPPVASEPAGGPAATSGSGQAAPTSLSPYKAVRARSTARLRAKLLAPPASEINALRAAFEDLILLMERVGGAAALVENDPLGSIHEAGQDIPAEPAPAGKIDAVPEALDSSGADDGALSVDALHAASPPEIEEPAYIEAPEPEERRVSDPKKRENVAPGLVSFHRDMQVPRVAPFIINPGQAGPGQPASDNLDD